MKKLKKYTRTVSRWFGFERLRPPEDEDLCSVSTLSSKSRNSVETLENGMPQRYSYEELVTFTSNFWYKIGSGEFSDVYEGLFPNGVKVAVKMVEGSRAKDVSREVFEAKVISFATTYHKRLIKLYGFCSLYTRKAVVYEFMENGSFDSILANTSVIIEWKKMYGIALDIGKAFAYLHHGCDNPIIYGNFSTANVLLDGNFCAKLSLFGISKLTETNDGYHSDGYHSGSSNHSRRGNGRHTYTPPEQWISAASRSLESDVYAFGMMLFEILGRSRHSDDKGWFPRVVWGKLEKDQLEEIFDECSIRKKDRNKATILATVACWCIQFTAEARPSMRTVVAVLEKKLHVNMPPEPFTPSNPGISMQPVMDYSHVVDLQQNCNNDKGEATEPVPDINGRSRLDIHQNTESVEEQLIPDSDGRGEMDSQQNCNSFKEEATEPVPDINGRSRLEIHQNTESVEEQLMPDTDGHGEVDSQQNCNSNQEEATEPVPDINGRSRLEIHQNTESREEKSMPDTDGRGLVDSQQNCDGVKNEAIELVPYINGRSRLDMHQNTERIEEQLMRDTDGRGDAGNERKLEKLLLYVEKKRSITNDVCGSILAKMEELTISCSIIEEERKIKESRRYVEMKQSITDEVCESILKIIKV